MGADNPFGGSYIMVVPVSATIAPAFLSHLDEQLSVAVLQQAIDSRADQSSTALLAITQQSHAGRQMALAEARGDPDLIKMVQEANGQQVSTTFFGRNFAVIDRLREGNYLPQRPIRILEGGIGLYQWKYLDRMIPNLSASARQSGYRCDGMPYEIFELGLLATKEGRVDAVELDERILLALEDVWERGLFTDAMQPTIPHASKILGELLVAKNEETVASYNRWMNYQNHFFSKTSVQYGALAVPYGDHSVDVGAHVFFSREVFAPMRIFNADLATFLPPETYDLAWLVNVYHYMSEPLWWALLIRTVLSLPVAEGILVTNRFDLDAFVMTLPFAGRIGEFLTLAGLELLEEVKSPLEHNRSIIIARRVQETPWLLEQAEKLHQLGL